MLNDENDDFSARAEELWSAGEKEPKLLFKFKSLQNTIDLDRLFTGLKENNLFFPTVKQLNDSLEGRGTRIISSENDIYEDYEADKYRVLSFSENCFSPVMWSHYGHNRMGVALGFYKGNSLDPSNTSAFKDAEKVIYSSAGKNRWAVDGETAITQDLLEKMKDWEYEREWRIIRSPDENSEQNEYFSYNFEDLACIILGEKSLTIVETLVESMPLHPPIYKVGYDAKKYCLVLKRQERIISSIEELINDLHNEKDKRN